MDIYIYIFEHFAHLIIIYPSTVGIVTVTSIYISTCSSLYAINLCNSNSLFDYIHNQYDASLLYIIQLWPS